MQEKTAALGQVVTKDQPESSNQSTESPKKSEIPKSQRQKRSIMATGKSKTLKFAGPIKILVIESKGEYCKTIWCAVGIGMSHIMIGATNMAVLLYYMKSWDIHALTCTLAYHFFSAEAILSLNYANGWSTPMRLRHRRFVHVILQMCAMVCAILGTALVILDKGVAATAHGITDMFSEIVLHRYATSMIAGILAVLSALLGAGTLFTRKYLKLIHISFGMPTFLAASICFCSGLFKDPFASWADITVLSILLGFNIFYTIFIIVTPFIKCMINI